MTLRRYLSAMIGGFDEFGRRVDYGRIMVAVTLSLKLEMMTTM